MKTLLPAAAIVLCTPALYAITYSDGTFTPSNWGFETVGSGVSTPAQIAAGGNPGSYRQIDHTVNQNTGWYYSFSRYGTTNATRYEPAVQGAIASLDFSIDARVVSTQGGQLPGLALGAKQGTLVFMQSSFFNVGNPAWGGYGVSGLTAASFTCINGAGSLDLSAGGAPIRFGFVVLNASFSPITTGSVSEYDNFSVTAHAVPAPSALGVAAGVGLAGAGLRRRRR
jgi:hypothetical protein